LMTSQASHHWCLHLAGLHICGPTMTLGSMREFLTVQASSRQVRIRSHNGADWPWVCVPVRGRHTVGCACCTAQHLSVGSNTLYDDGIRHHDGISSRERIMLSWNHGSGCHGFIAQMRICEFAEASPACFSESLSAVSTQLVPAAVDALLRLGYVATYRK
jgi:hypothetical protein